MSSTLDTAMNRGMAMVVDLAYAAQLERAKELEQQYPEHCWVSDVSTVRDSNNQPVLCPTFYYLPRGHTAHWVNEDWIRIGAGTQLSSKALLQTNTRAISREENE